MSGKRTGQRPEASAEVPRADSEASGGELSLILERQRAELEGCVAEADRRAAQAYEEADRRIEQQRREAEARIEEVQHRSEEQLGAQRGEAQARVDAAERRLEEAEKRAAGAEEKLKAQALRPRAARKLSEAKHALKEERAAGQGLRGEVERLELALQGAQEQGSELRRSHAGERAELQSKVEQLEARTQELEATLEREQADLARRVAEFEQGLVEAGAEHAREHKYRRELEVRLIAELNSGEDLGQRLETEAAAAATHLQRVKQLENELREAREEASAERAERRRFEQHLETLLHGATDTRTAHEEPPGESEPVVGAAPSPESAHIARDEGSWIFEGNLPLAGGENASVDEVPTPERPGNGQPPHAPEEAHPEESNGKRSGRSRRWRRRPPVPCAVCQRPRPDRSDTELSESGWALSRDGALCAACQERGWQLPADATVPFRAVDARGE